VPTTSGAKARFNKAKNTTKQVEEDDEDEVLTGGTVKLQEKGKKKAHQFKLDKEKISQPICVKYYQPLDLVVFALVNR